MAEENDFPEAALKGRTANADMISWGNKAIEVRARLAPRFLWETASIDVPVSRKCIICTAGQAKITGSHNGSFELKRRIGFAAFWIGCVGVIQRKQ